MKRSMIGVVMFFGVVVLTLVLLNPAHGQPGDPANILDDPIASRRGVFEAIYKDAGYSARDAEYLASRTLNHLRGYATRAFEPLDPVDSEVVLDPDGDALALFQRYLMDHGIDEDTATRETGRLWMVLQPGFDGEEATARLDSGCVYYIARVIYCVPDEFGGPGLKSWAEIRIDANCFDLFIDPKIPDQLPACTWPEERYFELDIYCGGINGTAGVREITGPYEGPCDDVMSCECFALPAGDLSSKCCPPKGGCIGCPDTWW